ncbi:DUF4232 domain-containing protein [Actinoplanes sp. CA-142083]|uniref:DUF4232 domain-containing protein n=1 Tax=Actinoplanes sp. CA-142083 TaxID=3239903 RepID=UPI003D91C7AA
MKRLVHLLAAATLVLAATACSHDDPSAEATWVAPSGAASRPASAPATESASAGVTNPGATGTKPKTTKPANRCHTADLKASTGAVESNAGLLYVSLVFTNKSSKACSLTGYPAVAWVATKTGQAIDNSFEPSPTEAPPAAVTIAPKKSAHATLAYHHPGEVDPTTCKSVAVKGYNVTPPQETSAIFVKSATTACSSSGVNTGRVLAIATGSK